MLTGKQKDSWVYTTHLLVLLANINRDPNTRPYRFEDTYPFARKQDNKDDITIDEFAAIASGEATRVGH